MIPENSAPNFLISVMKFEIVGFLSPLMIMTSSGRSMAVTGSASHAGLRLITLNPAVTHDRTHSRWYSGPISVALRDCCRDIRGGMDVKRQNASRADSVESAP